MKLITKPVGTSLAAVILGLAALALPARAADEKAKKSGAPAAAVTVTNAPHAVFEVTSAAKDPFFPLSTRTAVVATPITNAPAQITAKDFKLMGLSGTEDAPLVIINDHSFAPGEKYFVFPLNSVTKVGVTVLQIKQYSATIQVDGLSAPLEISLSQQFR